MQRPTSQASTSWGYGVSTVYAHDSIDIFSTMLGRIRVVSTHLTFALIAFPCDVTFFIAAKITSKNTFHSSCKGHFLVRRCESSKTRKGSDTSGPPYTPLCFSFPPPHTHPAHFFSATKEKFSFSMKADEKFSWCKPKGQWMTWVSGAVQHFAVKGSIKKFHFMVPSASWRCCDPLATRQARLIIVEE